MLRLFYTIGSLDLVKIVVKSTATFCKNYISRKIMAHKLQTKMLLSNQIEGIDQYFTGFAWT